MIFQVCAFLPTQINHTHEHQRPASARRRVPRAAEPCFMSLRTRDQTYSIGRVGNEISWRCKLGPNLQVSNSAAIQLSP
jgi:hypothetical protein